MKLFQFSLRTLIVAVLLVSAFLGGWKAGRRHETNKQAQLAAEKARQAAENAKIAAAMRGGIDVDDLFVTPPDLRGVVTSTSANTFDISMGWDDGLKKSDCVQIETRQGDLRGYASVLSITNDQATCHSADVRVEPRDRVRVRVSTRE